MSNQPKKKQSLKEIVALEYKKCALDPVYFMRKYCKIQHPVRGKILFNLYDFQEDLLKDLHEHRFNIILKGRQLGISTISAAYALWKMTFNSDCTTEYMTSFDKKMQKISGMCADCHFKFETKLKIEGKFKDYELEKMKANIRSFIKDAEEDVKALKLSLNVMEFVNVDGRSEKWEMKNKEEYIKKIDEDFERYKKELYENYGHRRKGIE